MNQLFLAVVALAIVLQLETVAGAPTILCNKLEAVAANNRYLVLLYNEGAAMQITEIVNEYQSSLEMSGSGNGVGNAQSVIRSQLTYSQKQLSGTLSGAAISLVNLYAYM